MARRAREILCGAAAQDLGGRPGIDGQDLEDGPAPVVAGVAAARTARAHPHRSAGQPAVRQRLRFPGRDRGLAAAAAADGADEPLGDDAHQRRADQKARHSEIGEPGDRTGGVVRVEGREDEVSGQGRLHRHFRRFGIPDLSHHEDVRILAKHAANGGRKREADAGIHLHLAERREDQLHRILDRHDVHFGRRDVPEHRVEGRGLAAAGGTGDQKQPFPAAQHLAEPPFLVVGQPELFERRDQGRRIEHPQHRLFAEDGREGRNPQLDLLLRFDAFDAAVLGTALLGDVEPAEHLEAADDGLVHDAGKGVHGPQDAVDPKTHDGVVALGLEVDVRGAVLERLVEDAVEGGHDRAGGGLQVAGGLRLRNELLVRRGRIGVLAAVVGQLGFRGAQRRPQVVEAAVDPFDVGAGGDHDLYPHPQIPFEVRDGPAVEGICDRHRQGVRLPGERADGVPAGERRRESAGHHLRVEFQGVDRSEGESGVLRHRLRDVFFRKETFGHQGRLLPRRRQPLDRRGAAGHRGGDAPLAPKEVQQAGNGIRDGAGSGVRRCRRRRLVGVSVTDGARGGTVAHRPRRG